MQKKEFGKLLFLSSWAALCTIIFIYYPGKISYIHATHITDLGAFPADFQRVVSIFYLLDLLKSFTGIAIFSLATLGLGAYLLNGFLSITKTEPPKQYSSLALTGTAFLFGHTVFSSVFILFGRYYGLKPSLTLTLMAVGLATGFMYLIKIQPITQIKKWLQDIKETSSSYYKFIFYLCVFIWFLCLLYSSSRVSYDAVAFYFSDQKATALTHHIQFFQNNSFVASDFQNAIPNAALMQVFGDQAARMYPWVNGIMIILFGLAIAKKTGLSPQARIIWISLLLTSTAFIDLTGDGKVDLTSTNAAIAVVYWLVSDQKSHRIEFLIGILTGLAIALRPFNAFLVSSFVIFIYLIRLYTSKSKNILSMLTSGVWIGIGATCMIALHVYINWLILGNPLAMLVHLQSVNSATWQWTFDPKYIWVARLFYPLTVTFMNVPQSDGNISPLFVAFLPFLFLKNIRKKTTISASLAEIAIAASITLILWINLLFTVVEIRYVWFLWIILFMPMAVMVETVFAWSDLPTAAIFKAVFAVMLVFISFRVIYISIHTYSPIDKNNEPICRDLASCKMLEVLNKAASPGDRVLVMNPYRYYLRSDLLMCSSQHDEIAVIKDLSHQSAEDFWSEIYRQGYKYIIYEANYGIRHILINIVPSPNNTPKWIKLETLYESQEGDVALFQINAINPPENVEKGCAKISDKLWAVQVLVP